MIFSLFEQRYQSEAKIEQVDGLAMVKEMAEDMENMMADKIDAIKVSSTRRKALPSVCATPARLAERAPRRRFWRSAHRSRRPPDGRAN